MKVASPEPVALGIDVGGSATRWMLLASDGTAVDEGSATGFSGAQMLTEAGRAQITDVLRGVAAACLPRIVELCRLRVVAGVTGIGAGHAALERLVADVLGLSAGAVRVVSDMEIAYRAVFDPGRGYLVYAGTGSIAAFIDQAGTLHRAGGRGVALDDAGGGYWIAREALRRLWRREDECPGAWRASPLAKRLFERVGGDSSIFSARFLMERARGEIGMLALDVAHCCESDEMASAIMQDAGTELGRLANAMIARHGVRPVAVAGRAAHLHPVIGASMRSSLASGVTVSFVHVSPQLAAARMAL